MDTRDPNEMTQINVRLTAYEHNRLRILAASAGMSMSEYIRQTAVYSKPPSPIEIDLDELVHFNFELRKQGANLNQLMHFLNTYGGVAYDAEQVRRLLDRMLGTADEASVIIQKVRSQFK